MEQYTIYCTEDQTKKAFEQGAPIITISEPLYNHPTCGRDWVKVSVQGNSYSARIPTAEQMIGWLEEQGIWIHFCKSNQRPELLSYSISKSNKPLKRVFIGGEFPSRKEATLAAIDAALDYLIRINR